MIFLCPGSYIIPAQTIVESKVRADTKTVLSKQVTIGSALVKHRRGLLRIEVGRTQQEVGEAVSRGLVAGAKERKRPVRDQVGILFDLVPDVASTHFDGMVADGPRETVSQIVCVVHLSDGERIRSYGKPVEEHL